jgi:hypothetical protein
VYYVHIALIHITALANCARRCMHVSVTHAVGDSWVVIVGAGEIRDSGA